MRRVGLLVVERRNSPSRPATFLVSCVAVLLALGVASALFQSQGVSPLHAYSTISQRVLLNHRGQMEIIRRTIPLLLCGVGLTVAFKARFWNIGAEGQLLAGAVAATGVALYVPMPSPWHALAMFLAGFLAGGLWGLIPALLKVKLRVNDVISTLMLNYVMLYIVEWLIHGPWRGPTMWGFPYTDIFPPSAQLPVLAGTRVSVPTLAIACVAALVAAGFLKYTQAGYESRVVGLSPLAAHYAGISFLRINGTVMLVAGGLAGIAGVGEVAAVHHQLFHPGQVSMGYGYTAITVAWLARGSPLATILTSALFGVILASGDVIRVTLRMPFQLIDVFSALVLFFLIGSEWLMYWRVRLMTRGAQ